jgi:alpha-methylacyl-CoA racemase
MMLADHGAEVIRIDRPGAHIESRDPLLRSRTVRFLDLKSTDGQAALRDLVKTADGLIEGFRPGVMERLGLGPDVLLADNPQLVYGRMTGWGQDGFYAARAGHDINYIAASGALHMIGRKGEAPVPPLNLVGDFGGGGMMLAFGMVSALLAVKNGAAGQVIDCAMTDGSALLTAMMWGFRASGFWQDERGSNILDTAAPFYDVYETSDGKHIAVGAIEPQFYAMMLHGMGLSDDPLFAIQMDIQNWPAQKAALATRIKTKNRDAWAAIFDGLDACVTPVLSMGEALTAPHNRDRNTFINVDGVDQPAPAPRYSGTPCPQPVPPKT